MKVIRLNKNAYPTCQSGSIVVVAAVGCIFHTNSGANIVCVFVMYNS